MCPVPWMLLAAHVTVFYKEADLNVIELFQKRVEKCQDSPDTDLLCA